MANRATLLALAFFLLLRTGHAAIQITPNYHGDGWTETRISTFESAMSYLGSLFSPAYTGENWVIDAYLRVFDDPGILAAGAPTGLYQIDDLYYTPALFNHISGSPLISGTVITITFNDIAPWSYATSPLDIAPGEFSFYQAAIHEILHGLAFESTLEQDGSWPAEYPGPTIYDQYLAWFNGETLLPLTALSEEDRAIAYTSEDLVWIGQDAMAAYGGPVPIYAPDPAAPGSSISHLAILDLEKNYLMYPYSLPSKIVAFTLSPVELGMLSDMGYNVVPEPRTLTLLALALLAGFALRPRRHPSPR